MSRLTTLATLYTSHVQVSLQKPIGVRFGRGKDGRAYVIATDESLGDTDSRIQIGDKVTKMSASFGADIWEAKNFGQVMYGIKTRSGDVFLELLARHAPHPHTVFVVFKIKQTSYVIS